MTTAEYRPTTVFATHVTQVEGEWHFVAEDREELAEKVGQEIGLEQCGSCGCDIYRICREDDLFTVRCIRADYADGSRHGCGAVSLIVPKDENKVIF
jgi:hypothetical protein